MSLDDSWSDTGPYSRLTQQRSTSAIRYHPFGGEGRERIARTRCRSRAHGAPAETWAALGHHSRAQELHQDSAPRLKHLGKLEKASFAYSSLTRLQQQQGRLREAETAASRALELSAAAPDPAARARALIVDAQVGNVSGRLAVAATTFRQVEIEARAHEDVASALEAKLARAWSALTPIWPSQSGHARESTSYTRLRTEKPVCRQARKSCVRSLPPRQIMIEPRSRKSEYRASAAKHDQPAAFGRPASLS